MKTKTHSHQGRLETASLPRIVRDLWRAKATGNLHLWNRDATKRLVFKDGHIVFAGTNVEKEKLGERLVQAGKIDRSVLDLSFRVMERSDERFGKTIVEMGWMSPMEMQRYVATQIKDIIYSVFTWDEGDYRFEAVDDPVPAELMLELHTAEVIYEGACRVINIASIRACVGSWKNGLKLAEGERLSIPVTREDGFILSRVKEGASIGDVVSTSPLGEEESLRRIYALVLAGVLEIEELVEKRKRRPSSDADETRDMTEEERRFRDSLAARHHALELGDFYDRLEIDFGASGRRVREAYDEVMASLEPKAHFSAYLGNVEERLMKVQRKVREAYEVLSVPESRRVYDCRREGQAAGFSGDETIAALTLDRRAQPIAVSGTDSEEAELVFLEAKRLHNGGDYFDAIAALNRAVQLEPTNGGYHRLLAQWLAQNPGCWESAQVHFEQAIAIDDKDVEAHLGLAALHEEASCADNALSVYERVIELDPDNRIAREKLEPQPR
ncbi:MAG: DUF4388 domain-containing protein [Acidobacteria bacterium]|nr:MAG: DUF4388 domain-containing protein [Acidobacteriota bacterium]